MACCSILFHWDARHLLRGVADEQRRSADEDDYPAQPHPAVGVAVVQRVQLGVVHELHRPVGAAQVQRE
jgi:hypothetical protein